MSTELATTKTAALDTPAPVFRGAQMVEALKEYRALQGALDGAMPDQLMKIRDKMFRKKGYWRAIAVAFNLNVEPITPEDRERSVAGYLEDGSENYVYRVTYKATALSGRFATGDGTCTYAEKQRGRMEGTEHNVRSHAHTRAYNRAVSNLVAFGEVSAEEVEHDAEHQEPAAVPAAADGSVLILKVDEQTGGKAGGKSWVKWNVVFDNGKSGTTFMRPLAVECRKLQAAGARVIPVYETKGGYTNLVDLKFPPDQAELPTEHRDEEPPF